MRTVFASWRGRAGTRLALSVWFVYALFATTNVARETYLALSLAERGSIRVDEYLGLHSDLFEIPGRGGYINNNPGASLAGAVPLVVARPALAALFAWKPELIAAKPPAAYDDPRPNRSKFMNAARARGLDIKLGLAALLTGAGAMAPLGALAAWLLFRYLAHRGMAERQAAGWALAYAFATPLLFRSAFLNQNALLAHATLGAWIAMTGWRPRPAGQAPPLGALALAGLLLGFGLLCDYSAAPLLLVFGAWATTIGWSRGGVGGALVAGATFTAGALPMIGLLLGYQQMAFGAPWFPAQRYMPATEYSVIGWNGFFVPTTELLLGNLFDGRYGLFAFCPLLAAGLAIVAISRDARRQVGSVGWALLACAGLYVFSSANQFANLQWNTGVRYLVPLVPILFLLAIPVLQRLPGVARWGLLVSSLAISLAVSMTRESVPDAFAWLWRSGPTLPVFLVLEKMASGYPQLQFGAWGPLAVLGLATLALVALWWPELRTVREPART
ncbi:MAG: hypothetical protein IPK85_11910 [Gemmatimonadetes bacterium]|nr:hypothetical protein [Gemmatimonadota bacterium]